MASDERASKLGDSEPPPQLTPEQEAFLEASNTLRQYDRLVELIRASVGAYPKRRNAREGADLGFGAV